MAISNAERQAAHRAKKLAEGLVQFTVYVPADVIPDLTALVQKLVAERGLTVGPARNPVTGKLVSVKGK